jgi:alkyl sulfatase BDS1-like metallo-beta-lactamase superfamily hydrolase
LLPGPDAAVLAIKGVFRPEAAQGLEETYELHLGDEVIQVRVKDDAVEAKQGPIEHPDATIHTTDMKSYVALLRHQTSPEEALSKGLVRIEGDAGALGRFLDLFRLPRIPVEVDVRS